MQERGYHSYSDVLSAVVRDPEFLQSLFWGVLPSPTSAAWSFPRQLVKFGWLSAASWLRMSRRWNFSCVNNKLLIQILVTKVQCVF